MTSLVQRPGQTGPTLSTASSATDDSSDTIVRSTIAGGMLIFSALVPFPGDQLGWALLLGLLLLTALGKRAQLHDLWVTPVLLTFLSWLALSNFWSVEPTTSLRQTVLTLMLVSFGLFISVGRSLADLLELAGRCVTITLAACWVTAILMPSLGISAETDHVGALQGLFSNKNAFGFFSVLSLVTTCCHALSRPSGRRLIPWSAATLSVASILASTSKTALTVGVVLLFAAIVLASLARARRPLGLLLVSWGVALYLLVDGAVANTGTVLDLLGRDSTLTGRTHIWEVVRQAIAERPVTGYGWKALWIEGSPTTQALWSQHYGVPFWHAHNGYLDIAIQLGYVGLALGMLYWAWVLRHAFTGFSASPGAVRAWPILLITMLVIYNATEVVGFANMSWVLLVAMGAILPCERN